MRLVSSILTRHPSIIYSILLAAFVTIVFLRVGQFEFLAIDDAMHTQSNPYVAPFNIKNLTRFWSEPYENAFTPLTYTLWMVQAIFAQLPTLEAEQTKEFLFPEGLRFDPGIFHLGNLFAHILAVFAVYLILKELFTSALVAFLGSTLFAIHPLQVEPVCWITGFRDVLSGALGFFTVYLYLMYCKAKKHGPLLYAITTLLFLAATLAKSSSLSIIPMVLGLGIIVYKRPWKRAALEMVPWILLVIPLFQIFSQLNNSVALRVVYVASLPQRFLMALDAIAFYLWKLVVPFNLTMDYGRTPQYVISKGYHYATWAIPVFVAIGGTYLWMKKKNPWPFLAGLFFLAGLIPVLGIKPFIFQHISTVADRYTYFSILGASLLLCSVLVQRQMQTKDIALCSAYLVFLFVLSWKQVPIWKNNESLFSQVIQITPQSWLALNDLGTALEGQGRHPEAYQLYRRAAELSDISSAWNNAGAMALESKDAASAIDCFSHALRTSGFSPWAYYNLGIGYAISGQKKMAVESFQHAEKLNAQFKFPTEELRKPVADIRKLVIRKFDPSAKS